ncbi:MAG: hypothetical protein JWO13_943 [Acidobacteriales bacterium]|nr:hypothetical protein [Terriglobales bacterium]
MESTKSNRDNDQHKGAVEDDAPNQEHNTSLSGQLPHRHKTQDIEGNDSDYPEPGENPEHTGQDMDPGQRQKRNQGDKAEDPLAS